MSLMIDIDRVAAVLLADGWHDVHGRSLVIDAYEFIWHPPEATSKMDFEAVHGGGQSGVCATGFTFATASGGLLSGPLTAILAVKHVPRPSRRPSGESRPA